MSPKEKAQQLFNKFYKVPLYIKTVKQCCHIAVDEMLNNAGYIWGGHDTETGLTARDAYIEYWQEVKQEIDKL